MKKFTSPLKFSILRRLKKPFALIILFSCILSTKIISQAARLDQWQKIDMAWEYGNLNRKHSNYVEGETVPYRIFMSGLTVGTQVNFIIEFDITAPNPSPVKHGIDYLRTYNATIGDPPFNDATVLGDVPAGFFVPASTDIKAIPAPLNLSFLSGLSQGDMILKGGTIDDISYDDEGDPTSAHGKARVKVDFTPDGSFAVLLFGGHLAREQDYDGNGDLDFTNDDDGAGGIHGAPYHMRLESITGHQDRSVMVGLPNCPVVDDCFDDLYKCEELLNGTGTTPAAYFDLTGSSCDVPDDQWYTDADFTDPITDPENFLGHEGDVVYGKLSNDCGNSTAYLTLHVYSLPTINPLSDFSVCINALKFLLTAVGSDVGTFSGDGVDVDGYFDPALAGVGEHIITFTVINANSCSISRTFKITVTSLTTVTCPSNKEVCISDAPFALTGASPANGTYFGDGVNSILGIFTSVDAGLGSHTITYSYTDGNTCINTCSFTITVNPLPTFGTITPTATCSGTSNGTITLASCQANTNYRLKRCSDDYNVQGVRTCLNGTVVWTGLPAGCYYIVATNTTTGCTNTSGQTTVVGAICNTTLTQGFYGNLGGKDCNNKTAMQLITAAVGGSNKLFGVGCRSFTLKPADLTGSKPNIFKMLPGGTTPAVLGCVPASGSGANACFAGTATFDCKPSWQYVTIQNGGSKDGSINNVLLAQTMTLFFNLANSANLGTIKIEGNKLTFNNLACGSSTPGSFASIQYIPCPVFNYLNANYPGAGHPNINDVYDLANKVLGNVVTTISASNMNDALNAINVGFDKGKALMSQEIIACPPPVTRAGSQIITEVVAQKPVVTAYPNPFNDQVRFTLQSTESGKATLDVYNMVGQKVKTVFQGHLFANSPQTVEYKVPAHSPTENLIYIFRINGKQFTGKLINIRN
jgi:hypothetical protein